MPSARKKRTQRDLERIQEFESTFREMADDAASSIIEDGPLVLSKEAHRKLRDVPPLVVPAGSPQIQEDSSRRSDRKQRRRQAIKYAAEAIAAVRKEGTNLGFCRALTKILRISIRLTTSLLLTKPLVRKSAQSSRLPSDSSN